LVHWMTCFRSKLCSEAGQGLVEYGLIIILIAIAMMTVLALMAGGVGSTYSRIAAELSGATP